MEGVIQSLKLVILSPAGCGGTAKRFVGKGTAGVATAIRNFLSR